MPTISAYYAALLGLLFFWLSLRVSLMRIRLGISAGDDGNATLARAVRLQGNFVEYAPMAVALLLMLELQGAPGWSLHMIGLLFLAGRVLHGVGFTSTPQRGGLRKWGMIATYASLLVAGAGNIVLALT